MKRVVILVSVLSVVALGYWAWDHFDLGKFVPGGEQVRGEAAPKPVEASQDLAKIPRQKVYRSKRKAAVLPSVRRKPVPAVPGGFVKLNVDTYNPAIVGKNPGAVLGALEETYLLKPDQRFGLAIQKLYELAGKDAPKVEYELKKGEWQVYLNGEDVGAFEKFPSYTVLNQFLLRIAKTALRGVRVDRSQLGEKDSKFLTYYTDQIYPPYLLAVLNRLNQLWMKHPFHPLLLEKAAFCFGMLSFQSIPSSYLTDDFVAKGWALSVVTQSLFPRRARESQVLNAFALGYKRSARKLAGKLDGGNLIRAYLERNNSAFVDKAKSVLPSPLASLLYFRRLVELEDEEGALKLARGTFNKFWLALPFYQGLKDLFPHRGAEYFAFDYIFHLQYLTGRDVTAEAQKMSKNWWQRILIILNPKPSKSDMAKLFKYYRSLSMPSMQREFFRDLAVNEPRNVGPVFDRPSYRSFFLSHYFAALKNITDYLTHTKYSEEGAKSLSPVIFSTPKEPLTIAFKNWFDLCRVWQFQSKTLQDFTWTLKQTKTWENPAWLMELFSHAMRSSYSSDPATRVVARYAFPHLDSRPEVLNWMDWYSRGRLYDLELYEVAVEKGSLEFNDRSGDGIYTYLRKTGGVELLRKHIYDKNRSMAARREALRSFRDPKGGTKEQKIKMYQDLLKERPDESDLIEDFAYYMIRKDEFQTPLPYVKNWLHKTKTEDWLMRARMGSIYVKLLTELGRAEEACRIAPMYSKSFKLDTLQAHATCLALTNREAEAEKLALKGAKSYKTIFHLHAIVYALLLKRGRGQEIKELKKEHLGTISHDDMRFFAKFFRKIFVNENPAKVNSAVKSMSGISWKNRWINHLVSVYLKKDELDLAKMVFKNIGSNSTHFFDTAIQIYHYLKKKRGDVVARQFLDSTIPHNSLKYVDLFLFPNYEYDLVWDLARPQDGQDLGHYSWILRAASLHSTEDPGLKRKREAEVRAYVNRYKGHYYLDYARYFLGELSEEAMLKIAYDQRSLAEAYYFIGRMAFHKGDLLSALKWYRASLDLGDHKTMEYDWIRDEVRWWSRRKRYISAEAIRHRIKRQIASLIENSAEDEEENL